MRSVGENGLRALAGGRCLLFAVPLGCALVFLPGTASSAEGPTIEAAGNGPYYWNPSSAQTTVGGTATFKNPSGSVPHGVTWMGGPATPSCTNVPIDDFKTSWTGTCSFAQAGSYSFYCPVHPTEMKGTIVVSATPSPSPSPSPTPTPTPTSPGESPLQGPASQALKLATSQRGNVVRGSVNLSPAAVGGRLEVDLLAARAPLSGPGRARKVRVGRLVRSGLQAGRAPFAVSLKGVARRALRERGRLPLKVRLSIAPPGGQALVLNRSAVLHG